MKLEICHLYPDVLSGDQGNLLCMRKRLAWRGIEAEITRLQTELKDRRASCDGESFALGSSGQS